VRSLALLISLVGFGLGAPADASPRRKVLVAPIQGDRKNQLAQAIITALGTKDFIVIGPAVVGREIARLGLPDELTTDDARALTAKLGAAATVEGSIASAGRKRRLHLDVHPRGKPSSGFTIEFRTTTSDGFRRGLRDELLKKLDTSAEPPAAAPVTTARVADPAADEAEARRRQLADDEAAQRAEADHQRQLANDAAAARPPDHERVAAASDPADDKPAAGEPHPTVQQRDDRGRDAPITLARVDAGASFAQRQLSFETRDGFVQRPPRVMTTAGAGRIDGEIYPFALAGTSRPLGRLGFAAAYDKTFGLSIQVPDQAMRAPIHQSHYALGARYRFNVLDGTTVTFGVDYARRQYIADRSGLASVLDTPDVDYAAITPGAQVHVPITAAIAVFGGIDGMVLLDAGPIQAPDNYGTGTVYGVEATAGIGITFARRIALRIAFEFSQIHLAFDTGGAMATNRDNDPTTRDVNGAADRSIGGVATLGLAY
jgi:hypothetical protein